MLIETKIMTDDEVSFSLYKPTKNVSCKVYNISVNIKNVLRISIY